jgi:hypothetical protein
MARRKSPMQAPTMGPVLTGAQPGNQRVSPVGLKWRKEVMLPPIEPIPMSMVRGI